MNYNNTLEEFIDLFEKNFDNETIIEKYYLYVKELFFSYSKILNIEKKIDEIEKNNIIKKIKAYINEFINKSFGYLEDLAMTIIEIPKKIFYEIIIYIMEKLNENGKKCIKNNEKNCKYKSLIYFEKSIYYFKNFIVNTRELRQLFSKKDFDNFKYQIEISNKYIQEFNSGEILLLQDSIKKNILISNHFSIRQLRGKMIGCKDEYEKCQIIMENYKKSYECIKGKENIEEAICIANMIKIYFKFLGECNFEKYIKLGERCEYIAQKLKISTKIEWYKEFKEIFNDIKDINFNIIKSESEENIKNKYQSKFDEIEEKFNKGKDIIEFIKNILKNEPYKQYEEDKKNKINFSKYSKELLKYLSNKYNPNNYILKKDDEFSQLKYYIFELIYNKLNILIIKLNY